MKQPTNLLRQASSWTGRIPRLQEAGLLVVIFLIALVLTLGADTLTGPGGVERNAFLRLDNLIPSVATPMSWIAIMAIGATVVIIAGGIDLSVGSIMALCALATVGVLQQLPADAPWWQAAPLGLAVAMGLGLFCGLINGALIVLLRMHPFIVTLGTLWIFRGIANISVPTKTLPTMGKQLPDAFTEGFIAWRWYYSENSFVQPMPMLIMLAVLALAWVYLSHSIPGRKVYAVGGNEEAARFSGIRVGLLKLSVYAISGVTAGLAGLVSAGYNGSASTNTAEGYELMVIAAAVVGGASLMGGRGTALGAVLGALIIQLIANGIFILKRVDIGPFTLRLSQEYANIINGLAIVVAVAIDRLSEHLHRQRMARLRTQKRDSS